MNEIFALVVGITILLAFITGQLFGSLPDHSSSGFGFHLIELITLFSVIFALIVTICNLYWQINLKH